MDPANGAGDGDYGRNGANVGWMDLEPSSLHPFPPVAGRPSQALSLQSGASVLNVTDTLWSDLNPGEKLTPTISLGDKERSVFGPNVFSPLHDWNEATFFGLTDGAADLTTVDPSDTVANSGLIRNNPVTGTQRGNGSLVDVSFSHTVTKDDVRRPGRIGILIYSAGSGGTQQVCNQAKFDHVRLTRTPRAEVQDR